MPNCPSHNNIEAYTNSSSTLYSQYGGSKRRSRRTRRKMSHRRIRKSRKSRQNRRIFKNRSKRRNTKNTRRTRNKRRMRGGGDQEEIEKLQKLIDEEEEIKRWRDANMRPQGEGVNPVWPIRPEFFEDLWGDYCHRHNDNETKCKDSDLCSYKYWAAKNKCANNYGDLETARERMMEEIARQEEIARLQKLIQDLER